MTSGLCPNRHNHHQTIIRHTSATAAKSTQVQSGLQGAGWWPFFVTDGQTEEELRILVVGFGAKSELFPPISFCLVLQVKSFGDPKISAAECLPGSDWICGAARLLEVLV